MVLERANGLTFVLECLTEWPCSLERKRRTACLSPPPFDLSSRTRIQNNLNNRNESIAKPHSKAGWKGTSTPHPTRQSPGPSQRAMELRRNSKQASSTASLWPWSLALVGACRLPMVPGDLNTRVYHFLGVGVFRAWNGGCFRLEPLHGWLLAVLTWVFVGRADLSPGGVGVAGQWLPDPRVSSVGGRWSVETISRVFLVHCRGLLPRPQCVECALRVVRAPRD